MSRVGLSAGEYVEGIRAGNRAILGRAITLVESTRAADGELAQDIIERCLPLAGQSLRVGVTGAPGVGKSTFIEALGTYLTREREQRVAVLAVDPSSAISHGSILGDKTRMARLANDERAFVRPSPAGKAWGGVARRTRETMLLCEAAGYANVLVETVGVGQSETAVRSMVDSFLLLMIAGAGDELQGMKRGILEMADLIAINKADGDNKLASQRARREYQNALHLFSRAAPPVMSCSARDGVGVREIWEAIERQTAATQASGAFERNRREQAASWMHETIDYELRDRFQRSQRMQVNLRKFETQVREGRISPYRAAQRLLEEYEGEELPF